MTQESATPSEATVLERLNRRRRRRALLLSLIIFISGGACGWGGATLYDRHHAPMAGFNPDPPVDQIVEDMRRDLSLTDAQVSQLTGVYQTRFDNLKKIRDGVLPQFKEQYEQLRADVEKVLTPAQFDRWKVRFDAMEQRIMRRPPPPGHGPGGPGHDFGPPPGDRGPDGDFPPPEMRGGDRQQMHQPRDDQGPRNGDPASRPVFNHNKSSGPMPDNPGPPNQ